MENLYFTSPLDDESKIKKRKDRPHNVVPPRLTPGILRGETGALGSSRELEVPEKSREIAGGIIAMTRGKALEQAAEPMLHETLEAQDRANEIDFDHKREASPIIAVPIPGPVLVDIDIDDGRKQAVTQVAPGISGARAVVESPEPKPVFAQPMLTPVAMPKRMYKKAIIAGVTGAIVILAIALTVLT